MNLGYASHAVKTDAGGLLLEVYQVATGFHVDAKIPPSAAVQVISASGRCGKSALRAYLGVVWGVWILVLVLLARNPGHGGVKAVKQLRHT